MKRTVKAKSSVTRTASRVVLAVKVGNSSQSVRLTPEAAYETAANLMLHAAEVRKQLEAKE